MTCEAIENYFYGAACKRNVFWWPVKELAKELEMDVHRLNRKLQEMTNEKKVVVMNNIVVSLIGIQEAYGSQRIKRTDNRLGGFLASLERLAKLCKELAQFLANLFLPKALTQESDAALAANQSDPPTEQYDYRALNLTYFPEKLLHKKRSQAKKWMQGRKPHWISEDDLVLQFIVRELSVETLALAYDQMCAAEDSVTKHRLTELIRSKRSHQDYALFTRAISHSLPVHSDPKAKKRGIVQRAKNIASACVSQVKQVVNPAPKEPTQTIPPDEDILETAKFMLFERYRSHGVPVTWVWLWNEMVADELLTADPVEEYYPKPESLYEALGDFMNPDAEKIVV